MRIEQEGEHVRATTDRNRSYLLLNSEAGSTRKTIERGLAVVRGTFGPRWRSVEGPNLDPTEFELMVEEIALNWICFYTTPSFRRDYRERPERPTVPPDCGVER